MVWFNLVIMEEYVLFGSILLKMGGSCLIWFNLVKMEEFMFGLGKISSFYSVHIWFGTI